jgi:trans-2,3-dihydro-3-hydroxyanthranilate isomerase
MPRHFYTLDVFTKTALAGNPLAVVLDSEGLDDYAMQNIAREFNLSETVFVFPPQDESNRAALRIFTPASELPFAGHPTVGTAILLALLDGESNANFRLEEKIGLVECAIANAAQRVGEAIFTLPRLPERIGIATEASLMAKALGVTQGDIGFDRHKPILASAGVAFTLVPLRTKGAVTNASINTMHWSDAFGVAGRPNAFVYTRETVDPSHQFHARMFAPHLGIGEDPATGSAVAAFARAVVDFEQLVDGEHRFVIEQGYAMGRPSQIVLEMDVRDGALIAARIGGAAVVISEGRLHL